MCGSRPASKWMSVAVLLLWGWCPAIADPPLLPGWNVAWFDEFQGSQVDTSRWDVIFSTSPTNNSLHAYLPSQVTVSGGNLVITSQNQSFGGLPYRSGQVISKTNRQYGRWEVRAKLPTSRGMWPAIWLLPDTSQYPWPSQGEIDIMENRGDQPSLTSSAYHWGRSSPYLHLYRFQEQQAVHGGIPQNYHDSFHTYAVEWEPAQLRFYVDGVHHYTVYDAETNGFLSQQSAGMELVMNTAIGGDFLANPDGTTVWPQRFLIDHVYVYEPASSPAPLTFDNGDFETNGGTLAEWSTFGNRLPNVQTHVEAVRSGSSSLKLYGQFDVAENYSGVEQGITVSPGEELRAVAHSFVRSADSIAGTNNVASLKIDFYNQRYGQFGSSAYLGSQEIVMADGASPQDTWRAHELRAMVPAGAVEARLSLVFRQPSRQSGAVHIDDVLFGRPGDYTLTWDGQGDGLWHEPRWVGTALGAPTDFDRAVIRSNGVTVTGSQAAFETHVETGRLKIQGTLGGDVLVEAGGTIVAEEATARVQGDLQNRGVHRIDPARHSLFVTGAADVEGALVAVGDDYMQLRGTTTGDFTLVSAGSVAGTFATTDAGGAPSHLGHGYFMHRLSYASASVLADIYAALPGDANGDGLVDGQDFNIWNSHKFQNGTDWLAGDFNGDGATDGTDFNIWNQYKFSSADHVWVPEPGVWILAATSILALAAVRCRR